MVLDINYDKKQKCKRNETRINMSKKIMFSFITAIVLLSACGNDSKATMSITKTPIPSPTPQPTQKAVYYENDLVIDHFIDDYNKKNDTKISDVTQGNISQKAYAFIGNVYIEILNAYPADAERFSVSVFGGTTSQETEEMFNTFKSISKILDPELSDEEIDNEIGSLKANDVLAENVSLGNLTVTYVPSKELSYGNNSSRIDVSSSVYGKSE